MPSSFRTLTRRATSKAQCGSVGASGGGCRGDEGYLHRADTAHIQDAEDTKQVDVGVPTDNHVNSPGRGGGAGREGMRLGRL